jgi:hypothetical protein
MSQKKKFFVPQKAVSISNIFAQAVAASTGVKEVVILCNMHESLDWFGLDYAATRALFARINNYSNIELFSHEEVNEWDRLSPWIALDMDEILLQMVFDEVEQRYISWYSGNSKA